MKVKAKRRRTEIKITEKKRFKKVFRARELTHASILSFTHSKTTEAKKKKYWKIFSLRHSTFHPSLDLYTSKQRWLKFSTYIPSPMWLNFSLILSRAFDSVIFTAVAINLFHLCRTPLLTRTSFIVCCCRFLFYFCASVVFHWKREVNAPTHRQLCDIYGCKIESGRTHDWGRKASESMWKNNIK